MNTNMTGFQVDFKTIFVFVLWPKVASALKELRVKPEEVEQHKTKKTS